MPNATNSTKGGMMRLAWGGTVNIEYPLYSDVTMGLLKDLGIDIPRLLKDFHCNWADDDTRLTTATWFDAERFDADVLIPGFGFRSFKLADLAGKVDRIPVSETARAELKGFLSADRDVLEGMNPQAREHYLHTTNYRDFLRKLFSISDEAFKLFSSAPSGFWGVWALVLQAFQGLPEA